MYRKLQKLQINFVAIQATHPIFAQIQCWFKRVFLLYYVCYVHVNLLLKLLIKNKPHQNPLVFKDVNIGTDSGKRLCFILCYETKCISTIYLFKNLVANPKYMKANKKNRKTHVHRSGWRNSCSFKCSVFQVRFSPTFTQNYNWELKHVLGIFAPT
jgi:hypothetical protein